MAIRVFAQSCHSVKIKYNTSYMCSSCLFFTQYKLSYCSHNNPDTAPFTGYRRIGRVLVVCDVYPGSFGSIFYLDLPV